MVFSVTGLGGGQLTLLPLTRFEHTGLLQNSDPPTTQPAMHSIRPSSINGQTGPYHEQFVIIEDSSAVLDASEEYSSNSDTEYDTDIHGNGRSSSEDTHPHDYFALPLDILPRHSFWRTGKGSPKAPQDTRGVDILPIRPGQREAKKIVAVHAIVQFNVDSGTLVLRAGSNKPIWYLKGPQKPRQFL